MSKQAVVILSGGLDSTILTYDVVNKLGGGNVAAISFNYGQKQKLELQKAALTCDKLGVLHNIVDMGWVGQMVSSVCSNISGSSIPTPTIEDVLGDPQPNTYVPFRNQIMITLAASWAEVIGATEIYMGLQCHDLYGYWDTTPNFVKAMNNILSQNRNHKITLLTPYISWSKKDEILLGVKLNVPFEDSLTCYNPAEDGTSCGVCPSCSERKMNFNLAGVQDPIHYKE